MLFLLYVSISLGIQVQRLQSQVGFVGDELRDLRLFGLSKEWGEEGIKRDKKKEPEEVSLRAMEEPSDVSEVSPSAESQEQLIVIIEPDEAPIPLDPTSHPAVIIPDKPKYTGTSSNQVIGHDLGRVVWGRTAWERWAAHPT
jgi:hypothetical protein